MLSAKVRQRCARTVLSAQALDPQCTQILHRIPQGAQALQLAPGNLAAKQALDCNDACKPSALPQELAARELASDQALNARGTGLLVRFLRLLERKGKGTAGQQGHGYWHYTLGWGVNDPKTTLEESDLWQPPPPPAVRKTATAPAPAPTAATTATQYVHRYWHSAHACVDGARAVASGCVLAGLPPAPLSRTHTTVREGNATTPFDLVMSSPVMDALLQLKVRRAVALHARDVAPAPREHAAGAVDAPDGAAAVGACLQDTAASMAC